MASMIMHMISSRRGAPIRPRNNRIATGSNGAFREGIGSGFRLSGRVYEVEGGILDAKRGRTWIK